jgi:AcrR family transcriptional regulator
MARPPHKPTPTTRRRVAIAAGAGWAHSAIALSLGVSRTTLLKHYRDELRGGAARRRMLIAEALYRSAMRGNVAAMRAFLAAGEQAAGTPSPTPLGKKARAQLDAQNAEIGTDWEDLLPGGTAGPKLH